MMAFIEMFLISLLKIFMVIKSKRSYLLFGFDIVMITTKQTEARRWSSWTWSWSPTSCGPSISSLMIGISWLDGSLIVELFKQRDALRGAMSSVDFHLWHHYTHYSGAFSSWPCLVTNYVHIGASL